MISDIGQTEIKNAAFLHHLLRNLSNPMVLKSSGLRSKVFCCAQRTSEVFFSYYVDS